MRITLIRHAKSSWKDPALDDFERPLNARGRRDAPRMAAFLARRLAAPDRLVASDAVRARATAAALARAFGLADDRVIFDHRAYAADSDALLELIRETPGTLRHLALVGHNPGITHLVQRFDPDAAIDNLPTMGVADIELRAHDWLDVGDHCGHLVNLFVPRALPD